MWAAHDVQVRRTHRKRVQHPEFDRVLRNAGFADRPNLESLARTPL
ncbi:hypothetical protein ACW9HK_25025 [Nocardia gipuzkoensis]